LSADSLGLLRNTVKYRDCPLPTVSGGGYLIGDFKNRPGIEVMYRYMFGNSFGIGFLIGLGSRITYDAYREDSFRFGLNIEVYVQINESPGFYTAMGYCLKL